MIGPIDLSLHHSNTYNNILPTRHDCIVSFSIIKFLPFILYLFSFESYLY